MIPPDDPRPPFLFLGLVIFTLLAIGVVRVLSY